MNLYFMHRFIINTSLEIEFIDSEDIKKSNMRILNNVQGIVVPGGFGNRGINGKILTAQHARVNNIYHIWEYV